jgi:serine protease
MIKNVLFSFLLISFFSASQAQNNEHFALPNNITERDLMSKTIIFKVKKEYRPVASNNKLNIPSIDNALKIFGVTSLTQKYPHAAIPESEMNAIGRKLVDLTLIYEVKYAGNINIEKAINILLADNKIEYAQPHYIPKPLYSPNDPLASNQYHLAIIHAYQAWSISMGDTNVIISITDNGTDLNHPDLVANVKHNYADPINGIDDDHDGYIDNFNGWDLGSNDNNPTVDANAPTPTEPFHGSVVCGLAAAVSDNGIGIAGVGFNCKFLPVKISDTTGTFTKAYEGIQYAADHGARIINCSWGGYEAGQYEQNIIDYATNNKDILVVAAAGNDNNQTPFYPATLDGVLSVAATTQSDVKWTGSSYGVHVDISAPGEKITSTQYKNGYTIGAVSGTSFASPIVAGCAAIIRSKYPLLNALQVGEQLRVTADIIDTIAGNAAYKGLLGKGRVNLYNALINSPLPSVRMISYNIKDNNDSVFLGGDTLRIRGNFENYLEPTSAALTATISSTSPYVIAQTGTITLGNINTLQTKNNNAMPFVVKLAPNTPTNSIILFKITYNDGAYSDYEYLTVAVSKDYVDINANYIGSTITSKGPIGYNGQYVDGRGFTYKGSSSILSEMGFMIGVDSVNLSDCLRNNVGGSYNNDFKPLAIAKKLTPPVVSEFDINGVFDDSQAAHPLNVRVKHSAYAYTTLADRNYIIVEYTIKNNSITNYNKLYAGLFADWDIINSNENKAKLDTANKMGYVYYTKANPIYAGIKILTKNIAYNHYAIDNTFGGSGGIDLSNGFSKIDKFKIMTIRRDSAGNDSIIGNDVAHVVNAGPFALAANDSIKIAFALIAGDSLKQIQNAAKAADLKYNIVLATLNNINKPTFSLNQNYPNPANDNTVIGFTLAEPAHTFLEIYNVIGTKVLAINRGLLNSGSHEISISTAKLSAGIYYYRLISGNNSETKKMILNK